MRIQAQLQRPQLNVRKLSAAYTAVGSDAIAQAAIAWIEAALGIIPVWSGASHATFLHLARAVGYSLPIDPVDNAPKRLSYGLRTSSGSVGISASAGQFTFSYDTSLKHLVYNEYHNANVTPDPDLFAQLINPGPYNFQEQSRRAALDAINDLHLPDPKLFIQVKTKSVG